MYINNYIIIINFHLSNINQNVIAGFSQYGGNGAGGTHTNTNANANTNTYTHIETVNSIFIRLCSLQIFVVVVVIIHIMFVNLRVFFTLMNLFKVS